MTERIRWTEDTVLRVWSGHVGEPGAQWFTIAAPLPDSDKGYLLMSRLPGMDFSCSRPRLEEVQAEAEDWLAEFISSLGAIFPEDAYEFPDDGELLEVKFAAGARVRFAHPDAGYPGEAEEAMKALTPGKVYSIAWADIGQSRTDLNLAAKGKPLGRFNSVLFEPVDDQETAATAAAQQED